MVLLIALMLTVMTGFAGLVYEVAWQKYLAVLLGSHGESTAAILAIFLGGLSAGYAIFGSVTRRVVAAAKLREESPRLLTLYAYVEAAIGCYALLFPTLFGVAQKISLFGPGGDDGLGFAFDVLLSALLIGPPAVLMGGTIPILTLALAGNLARATRVHAWVYGCNTIGAFAGALAGGFFLLPWLGLDGVVYCTAFLNLGAAIVFTGLERRVERVVADPVAVSGAPVIAGLAGWSSVALLAGFAMMALQTTLNRLGALALGSSQFTFAMVVAVFVLCIAIGSLVVGSMSQIPRGLVVGSQWALVALLFPLYLLMDDVGYWAYVIRNWFPLDDAAFYPFHMANFTALLIILAIPIGLSGALLPLLFDALRREVAELGSVAGRLYAWNTIGSLLGSLLGGYLLLFWFDLHHVFRISMVALALGAAILTALVYRESKESVLLVAAGLLLLTLAGIASLPEWSSKRLAAGLFRLHEAESKPVLGADQFFASYELGEVIFYEDDPTVTVSVNEQFGDSLRRSILVNGKSDGELKGDYPTMSMLGLIPAIMAEKHERSFVIGWGTGVTAGELASLTETGEVRVAEISRGVIASAPWFEHGNRAASANPKVHLQRGDAYRVLLKSEGQYDVIVSEPSNPWVAGVEMLFSRDFLEAARDRLTPGGVYAQWLHLYESDVEVVSLVMRTYAVVFPHVSVWYTHGHDVLLLGFNSPDRALDLAAMASRFHRPDVRAAFRRVGVHSFPQLLAHELLPLGTLHAMESSGSIHTLRHPILSHVAARAFFSARTAWLPSFARPEHEQVATKNSLLRRFAGSAPRLPESLLEIAARETCRTQHMTECASLFARWVFDYPNSTRLPRVLGEVRKRAGPESKLISQAKIYGLWELYGDEIPEAMKARVTVGAATEFTNRFLTHYHHAVPFNHDLPAKVWNRCKGSDCETVKRRAMEQLGSFTAGD